MTNKIQATYSGFPLIRAQLKALIIASLIVVSTSCTRPQKPTAVGSGVGGTVGAGLGAIIGSQSGNAGGGLMVGALAGAATGALVGNALQAQDERNRAQDETIKRQEQMLVAQRNEIAALRDIRSDLPYDQSPSYEQNTLPTTTSPFDNAPRYRYKSTSVTATSPAVERARSKLRQRGPNPNGTDTSYQPRGHHSVKTSQQPTLQNSTPKTSRRSIARFDVRTELNNPTKQSSSTGTKKTASRTTTRVKPAASLPSKPSSAKPSSPKPSLSGHSLQEEDLVVPSPAKINAPRATSAECSEALKERDRANTAQANSDKLYHLRRALRLCPNNAPLHYTLGSVYASMDRRADAENEYKEALKADPSFSLAQKALGDILKEEIQF
jgi:tetratricopeptide (TPR) repeat protein